MCVTSLGTNVARLARKCFGSLMRRVPRRGTVSMCLERTNVRHYSGRSLYTAPARIVYEPLQPEHISRMDSEQWLLERLSTRWRLSFPVLEAEAMRNAWQRAVKARRRLFPPTPMEVVRDHYVPTDEPASRANKNSERKSIVVRQYIPSGVAPSDAPAVIWCHARVFVPITAVTPHSPNRLRCSSGGGFVIGSVDCDDDFCRTLAHAARTVVFSVDYRLAPEHTYPCAHQDVLSTVQFIRRNSEELGIDRARIAIGGCSSGAAMAAHMSMHEFLYPNVEYPPLSSVFMLSPAVDFADSMDDDSFQFCGNHFLDLTKSHSLFFRSLYFADRERALAGSPHHLLRALAKLRPDLGGLSGQHNAQKALEELLVRMPSFDGVSSARTDAFIDDIRLPSFFVGHASLDPLHDSVLRFVHELRKFESEKMEVAHRLYEGVEHSFTYNFFLTASRSQLNDVAHFLHRTLRIDVPDMFDAVPREWTAAAKKMQRILLSKAPHAHTNVKEGKASEIER